MDQLIAEIHASPFKVVYAAAGAGSRALADLLAIPGASKTILEAVIPYDKNAFASFIGDAPVKFVSEASARRLAGNSLRRALVLQPESAHLLGLSCTAAIATTSPKKGLHHAWIACWSQGMIHTGHLVLHKGKRNRREEEEVVSNLVIGLLASACGLPFPEQPLLTDDDALHFAKQPLLPPEFTTESGHFTGIDPEGLSFNTVPDRLTILSGSFNPLHDGHIRLAQTAADLSGNPVYFELPLINADKPPLTAAEILQRTAQFAGHWSLLLSNAPTFAAKAAIYPGATFVVGFDTAARVLQPRFYGGEEEAITALSFIQEQGCRFLVAGRREKDGHFREAGTLHVPERFANLFVPIPDGRFRVDLSSTELRQARTASS